VIHGTNTEIYRVRSTTAPYIEYILKYYPWSEIKYRVRSDRVKPALSRIENEIKYHSLCDHPNIIKLVESHQTANAFFLVIEMAKGCEIDTDRMIAHDLFELLDSYHATHRFLPEQDVKSYFRQIYAGVNYLHSLGIIHGDLKTENILISEQGVVKIADFDWSRPIKKDLVSYDLHDPQHGSGTMVCYPPELFWLEGQGVTLYEWNQSFYNTSIDVWGLGLILYELLTSGMYPYCCSPVNVNQRCHLYEQRRRFSNVNSEVIQRHFLTHLTLDKITYSNTEVSPIADDLAKKMLHKDSRITMPEIGSHPFICDK
jgi:serine/threonine protein kinase